MAESSPNREKTLWEKEKLLVTSNFSFSHSVFKTLVLQTCLNQGLFGKGLTKKCDNKAFFGHPINVHVVLYGMRARHRTLLSATEVL